MYILVLLIFACSVLKEQDDVIIKANEQYRVICTLPDFDMTPINLFNGYIVRIDGQYGYMDINGSFIFDMNYEGLLISESYSSENERFTDACLFSEGDERGIHSGISVNSKVNHKETKTCGEAFGGPYTGQWTFDDYHGIYYYFVGPTGSYMLPYNPYILNTHSVYIYKTKYSLEQDKISLDTSKFYILSANRKRIFGPYLLNELPSITCIGLYNNNNNYKNMRYFTSISPYPGIFYEKTETGYFVWNELGSESVGPFDTAQSISFDAIKVKRGRQIGIVDDSLNVTMIGEYEDVSKPIHNRVCVKKNGSWKLIELN